MKKRIIITIIILLTIVVISIIGVILKKQSKVNVGEGNIQNEEAALEKRIILADILKKENDILITEGNVDNTKQIIKNANIIGGIYVQEASRQQFLEILNSVIERNHYTINAEGYLIKETFSNKNTTSIEHDIDRILKGKETLIVSIDDSYKAIVNGMQLDMMIERTTDVEIIEYDDSKKIAIINLKLLDNSNKKEIYENIIISLVNIL